MEFSDIHIHLLSDVDDGAETEEEMYRILDVAYADGIRTMCATPHFHPGYFGHNQNRAADAFTKLADYAEHRYPNLKLYLGNELRYSPECIKWLDNGSCRTLNKTRYVLVDFSENEKSQKIIGGLEQLLNTGYIPILAHAERYWNLEGDIPSISDLRANNIVIQMDSLSIFGDFGFRVKRWSKKLLSKGMVDLVSSDAHDLKKRPPEISRCYARIAKQYGDEYALALCHDNAIRILNDRGLERN